MTEPPPVGAPEPTADLPRPGGATRAPLAEGEAPELTPIERARRSYDLVSDILTPKTLAILVAVLALLVVGILGGWNQVETVEKAVPALAAGASSATGPFDVKVLRAYKGASLGQSMPKTTGTRYLIVVADVRTTGTKPQSAFLLRDIVTLTASDLKEPKPSLYRLSDGDLATDLQPGIDYQIVIAWSQADSAALPVAARLTINKLTWRASANDGSMYWLDPTPIGQTALDISPLGA